MPEVTPEKFCEYVDGWRAGLARKKKQMDAGARQALNAARSLAGLLAAEPGVRRVWLFGSLALYLKGLRKFTATSDIDLAVEGLPPERFFPVLSLLDQNSPRQVDLVDLADCSPFLRRCILERGLLLYERTGTAPDSGW
ncbi:MAG: nucleotidyltransferase domain-containing protein [Bacillota bacterium]